MDEILAAKKSVIKSVDKGNFEDALLTLNGEFDGLEYPDRRKVYEEAKAYFLTKAAEKGVDLTGLYAEYAPPE